MKDLKIRVSNMDEQSIVYQLLEKLGYDKLWYKKSNAHKFIFADKNGEIGIGVSKDSKNFEKSEHMETDVLGLQKMLDEHESKP